MGVKELLEYAAIEIKNDRGTNILCTCPQCGTANLHVQKTNGMFRCHKGGDCWKGNCWTILRTQKGLTKNSEISKILERFGIGGTVHPIEKTTKKGKPKLGPEDVVHMTPQEVHDFCALKQLCPHTTQKVLGRLFRHTTEPWALLPVHDPRTPDGPACGVLRARLDGGLITTSSGESKYPVIAGSMHSLWGVKWLQRQKYDTIHYCEGWRDMLVVAEQGLVATAGSGGAETFFEHWLPFFVAKTVYICMDADTAGQKGMEKARQLIGTVAKKVFFIDLPYEVVAKKGPDLHDFVTEDREVGEVGGYVGQEC